MSAETATQAKDKIIEMHMRRWVKNLDGLPGATDYCREAKWAD
jgi:hypothetical protein